MDEGKRWQHHATLTAWIPRGHRGEFARQLGISGGHLDQLCAGHRAPTGELCVAIERATLGRVTRAELRPDLFGPLEAEG